MGEWTGLVYEILHSDVCFQHDCMLTENFCEFSQFSHADSKREHYHLFSCSLFIISCVLYYVYNLHIQNSVIELNKLINIQTC